MTLPIVVFVSGAVVMVLELAASRIIAPYLGTSVVIWTSLIGVILASLAVGNWLGGKLADRYPTPQTLATSLLLAGILVGVDSHFQSLLSFTSSFYNLQLAALVGVFALFGPATIALGTIAPLAVKLSLLDLTKAGSIVGNLYAISNAGSIIGTFLGGFILISLVGSTRIITILALALFVLALLVLITSRKAPSLWVWILMALLLLTLVPTSGAAVFAEEVKLLADVDTRYNRTWVLDQQFPEGTVRVLSNSVGGYQSGMILEHPDELLFEYLRLFDSFAIFHPAAKNALMLGGAAYTYPRHFLAADPKRRATVVEIDPQVTELAREFFGLTDNPQLTIVHEDGRTYLNKTNGAYDVIFMDAFGSRHAIPFHLTTVEAVRRIERNLAPGGMAVVNIISSLEGNNAGFLAAEFATYLEVFPHVRVFRVVEAPNHEYQNVILIASREPLLPLEDSERSRSLFVREVTSVIPILPPFTDDFAPVERFTSEL